MEQALIEFGLSSKEVKVYLALTLLGTTSITPLAKQAQINRTTTYDIIESLIQHGLVSRVGGIKKETFTAEPPEKIPLLLEARMRKLNQQMIKAQSLVRQLKFFGSHQPGRPKISLYDGSVGIKNLYEDSLLSSEDIRSFSSTESLESFDPAFLHEYYEQRANKKIFIKAIINDVPSAHEYQKQDRKLHRELRIVPKEMMNIRPEIYIYNNKVAIFSLEEKFGVLLESIDIANALKKLYDLAWEKAKEYDSTIKKKRRRTGSLLSHG
ncbi:hypothetical protein HY621_03425 [Candidatus Uhrbacteria bacterium]|nr:hypothetical protein [Candidatus Uhrbacteria bacterium]